MGIKYGKLPCLWTGLVSCSKGAGTVAHGRDMGQGGALEVGKKRGHPDGPSHGLGQLFQRNFQAHYKGFTL